MLFGLDRIGALLERANGSLACGDFHFQHIDILAVLGNHIVAGGNERFLLGVLGRDFLRQGAMLRRLQRSGRRFRQPSAWPASGEI